MVGLLEAARRELTKRNQKAAGDWSEFVQSHVAGKRKKAPTLSELEELGAVHGLTGQAAIDAFDADVQGVTRINDQLAALAQIEKELAGLDRETLDRRVEELTVELATARRNREHLNSLNLRHGLITGGLDRMKAESAQRVYPESASLYAEPVTPPMPTLTDLPVDGTASFLAE